MQVIKEFEAVVSFWSPNLLNVILTHLGVNDFGSRRS